MGEFVFFFQAEDGIRDLVRSRGLGDVYKRQGPALVRLFEQRILPAFTSLATAIGMFAGGEVFGGCLLYTSDAADDLLCVDLGGRRIIKKKTA